MTDQTTEAEAPGSDHDIEISRDQWLRVSWRCDTCGWVGREAGSEMTARQEHARIAADIAAGKLAPAPAEDSAEGCHRCNGSGVLPTHDGEDEPCTCRPAETSAEGERHA